MGNNTREKGNFLEKIIKKGEGYHYDFFSLCRNIENDDLTLPRLGQGMPHHGEKVFFSQEPHFEFSASNIREIKHTKNNKVKIIQRFFGLLGPQGPMPLNITDYINNQVRHKKDTTLEDFLNIFHHRSLLLLYRAWALGRMEVNHDRPDEDTFINIFKALIGTCAEEFTDRDNLQPTAKAHFTNALTGIPKNPEKISYILEHYFKIQVKFEELVGSWYAIPKRYQCRLGSKEATLTTHATLGIQFYDCRMKFRLHIGPLNFDKYISFMPCGNNAAKLKSWISFYIGEEFEWEAILILKAEQVPASTLGDSSRLGWNSWIKSPDYIIPKNQKVCCNI